MDIVRLKSTGLTSAWPETWPRVDESVIGKDEMNEDGKNGRNSV